MNASTLPQGFATGVNPADPWLLWPTVCMVAYGSFTDRPQYLPEEVLVSGSAWVLLSRVETVMCSRSLDYLREYSDGSPFTSPSWDLAIRVLTDPDQLMSEVNL